MKLTIIIPAHNEEKRILKTLIAYTDYFKKNGVSKNISTNFLIVINNSKDKTYDIVKDFSKSNELVSFINLIRGGKGYAITEGFKHILSSNNIPDLIGFVDADMATLPEDYHILVNNLRNNDGIIASRYIPGAIVNPKPQFKRVIASRVFNLLIRSLFLMPFRDTQCGAKIFKTSAITKIVKNLAFSQWAFDLDLLYALKKFGFRVIEFPTKWSDKEYSKVNFFKAGPFMVLALIRLRIINSFLKRFIRVYDLFSNRLFRIIKK